MIRATAAAQSLPRVWVLADSVVTDNVFATAGHENSAIVIEDLGYNVTRKQGSTVTSAPLKTDCDLVVHLTGTVGGDTVLRGIATGAAPVLVCDTLRMGNASGSAALNSSATGVDDSASQMVITNVVRVAWTAGYSSDATETIFGSSIYQSRLALAGAAGGSFIWGRSTTGTLAYTAYGWDAGITNLASEVTTVRMASWHIFDGIQHLNTAGKQILEDVFSWLMKRASIIEFVAAGTLVEGGSVAAETGQTPGLPAGLAENDLILAVINRSGEAHTFNTPTGYTLVIERFGLDVFSNHSMAIFYKIATASESPPLMNSTGGGNEQQTAQTFAFRNVDTSTPFDVTPSATYIKRDGNIPNPNNQTGVAITTVTAGAWVGLYVAAHDLRIVTPADPVGFTRRAYSGNFDRGFMFWTIPVNPARTLTPGVPAFVPDAANAVDLIWFTFALRPAQAS